MSKSRRIKKSDEIIRKQTFFTKEELDRTRIELLEKGYDEEMVDDLFDDEEAEPETFTIGGNEVTFLKPVAKGGFGEIYIGTSQPAENENLEYRIYSEDRIPVKPFPDRFAIKTFDLNKAKAKSPDNHLVRRFQREALQMSKLNDYIPNHVAQVYAYDTGFVLVTEQDILRDIQALNEELEKQSNDKAKRSIQRDIIEKQGKLDAIKKLEEGQHTYEKKGEVLGKENSYAAIVMDFIDGVDLSEFAQLSTGSPVSTKIASKIIQDNSMRKTADIKRAIEQEEEVTLEQTPQKPKELESIVEEELSIEKIERTGSESLIVQPRNEETRFMPASVPIGEVDFDDIEQLRVTPTKNANGTYVYTILDVYKINRQINTISQVMHHIMIHRDIKPENFMLGKDGYVKVLDLGLATQEEEEQNTNLTVENTVMGTVTCMTPEQTLGQKIVDHRTDVYSTGFVIHWLMTGGKKKIDPKKGTPLQDQISMMGGTDKDNPPWKFDWIRDVNPHVSKHYEFLNEMRYVTQLVKIEEGDKVKTTADWSKRPTDRDIEYELKRISQIREGRGGIEHEELTLEEKIDQKIRISRLYEKVVELEYAILDSDPSKPEFVKGSFAKNVNDNQLFKKRVSKVIRESPREIIDELLETYQTLIEDLLTDQNDGIGRLFLYDRILSVLESYEPEKAKDDMTSGLKFRMEYQRDTEIRRLLHYNIPGIVNTIEDSETKQKILVPYSDEFLDAANGVIEYLMSEREESLPEFIRQRDYRLMMHELEKEVTTLRQYAISLRSQDPESAGDIEGALDALEHIVDGDEFGIFKVSLGTAKERLYNNGVTKIGAMNIIERIEKAALAHIKKYDSSN